MLAAVVLMGKTSNCRYSCCCCCCCCWRAVLLLLGCAQTTATVATDEPAVAAPGSPACSVVQSAADPARRASSALTVEASWAYFPPQPNHYVPGCVLGDMDSSSPIPGGCRHYSTLAEAISVCDRHAVPVPGCVPTTLPQPNGCHCSGVSAENGLFRLGAFEAKAGG